MTDDEVRDDPRRVVWYDSIGTATPAAPVLVGAVELNAFTGSRYIRGYSKKSEEAKKATHEKKGDQRSKSKHTETGV